MGFSLSWNSHQTIAVYALDLIRFEMKGVVVSDRFLGYLPMIFLAFTAILNLFIYSWATYLRCHKKEPFLVASVSTGIANCISTLVLGKMFGLYGITIGYVIITSVFFVWGYNIYKNKRWIWHSIAANTISYE